MHVSELHATKLMQHGVEATPSSSVTQAWCERDAAAARRATAVMAGPKTWKAASGTASASEQRLDEHRA